MSQLSTDEVLKAVIEKWKHAKVKWADTLGADEFETAYLKGQKLNTWGDRVKDAIKGLGMDRCNQLTVEEIAAYLKQSQKNAEVKLKLYLGEEIEGSGPSEGGYHLHNPHRGRYSRWHYHRDPFDRFVDKQAAQLKKRKAEIGRASWKTAKGIALRQGKQRNEDRRQADIFADAAQLAADRLAGQPDVAAALKILAESQALLKAQGIRVELQLMPAFAAFLDAQTQDLSLAVTEPQPWLTDAQGRVVDHAGWPLAGAGAIRTLLQKGGTVESMSLMAALKREWKAGTPLHLWTAVAEVAMARCRDEHLKLLPKARAIQGMEKQKGMATKDRVRS